MADHQPHAGPSGAGTSNSSAGRPGATGFAAAAQSAMSAVAQSVRGQAPTITRGQGAIPPARRQSAQAQGTPPARVQGQGQAGGGPVVTEGELEIDAANAEELLQSLQDQTHEEELSVVMVNLIPVCFFIGLKLMSDNLSIVGLYLFTQIAHIFCDIKLVLEVGRGRRLGMNRIQLVWILILVFLTSSYIPGVIWSSYGDILSTLYFMQCSELEGHEGDFWRVGLIVTISCLVLKQGFLGLKAIAALIPDQPNTNLSKQGKRMIYKCIELACQLYCECVPILPWWHYLRTGGEGPTLQALSFVNGLFKICCVRLPQLQEVIIDLSKGPSEISYGSPTPANELAVGQSCTICTDVLKMPTTLECKHVFCTECITRWIEEEHKTDCPVCRHVIVKGGEWLSAESKALIFAF